MNMESVQSKIEHKKDTLEVDLGVLGKQNLEISSKSDFEYPEAIKKETGIIGYERTIISREQIEKYFPPNLSEEERKEISNKILFNLSNGRFPNESFNYRMGVFDKPDLEKPNKHIDDFKKDKFILQDIFGLDKNHNRYYEPPDGNKPDMSVFDVFDKETNMIIGCGYFSDIQKFYKKRIFDKNDLMIVSANGLNVTNKSFFGQCRDSDILNTNQINFGFDQQDKLFQDYISQSISLLRGLNDNNKIKKEPYYNNVRKSWTPNIAKIYPNLIFFDLFRIKEANNSDNNEFKYGYDLSNFRRDLGEKEDYGKKIVEKYGPAFNFSADSIDDMLWETNPTPSLGDGLTNFQDTYSGGGLLFDRNEISRVWEKEAKRNPDHNHRGDNWMTDPITSHLPVFINVDEIKQLKWGHASYASFWTEKGFNFLKIKHVDKFPIDETKKEIIEAKRRLKKGIDEMADKEIVRNKQEAQEKDK